MWGNTKKRSAIVTIALVLGCAGVSASEDAAIPTDEDAAVVSDDAGLDEDTSINASLPDGAFFPPCNASQPCGPPEGATIFSRSLSLDGVTEPAPVAYYAQSVGIGCEWVVVRAHPEGGVTIEADALGPGWTIRAPAAFTCVGTRCTLESAPSGSYRFDIESCSPAGRGDVGASGSIALDVDAEGQLVTLGYLSGTDTSASPSRCRTCD